MLRLLIALLLVFAATVVWRLLRLLRGPAPESRGPGKTRMVKCAVCELYVPEAEAVSDHGRTYCSTSHRLLGDGGPK